MDMYMFSDMNFKLMVSIMRERECQVIGKTFKLQTAVSYPNTIIYYVKSFCSFLGTDPAIQAFHLTTETKAL